MSRYLVTPQKMMDECLSCKKTIVDTLTGNIFVEDKQNTHYLEYLKWLDEGNTPEEWGSDAS